MLLDQLGMRCSSHSKYLQYHFTLLFVPCSNELCIFDNEVSIAGCYKSRVTTYFNPRCNAVLEIERTIFVGIWYTESIINFEFHKVSCQQGDEPATHRISNVTQQSYKVNTIYYSTGLLLSQQLFIFVVWHRTVFLKALQITRRKCCILVQIYAI